MANLKHFNSATGKWEEIKVSTKFKDLLNTVELTQDQNYINIGITNYNPVEDVIFVFLNSTWLQKDQDYVINGGLLRIESKDGSNWSNGDTFNFVVLKNVDKDDLPSADGSLIQNGSITIAKLASSLQSYINKIGNAELATVADDLSGAVNELSSQMNDIAIIPIKNEEESDYTNALQRCLDDMDSENGGIIKIPQGAILEFSEIEITKKNIKIIGGGRLKGKIIINYTVGDDLNFVIENVILENSIPIEVKCGRRFKIMNCIFENCDKSIYVNPDSDTVFHGIAMANISHNDFINVNYALYIDKQDDATVDFQVNDFTFSNNVINRALISHVYIKNIDGIIITSNTMFFPSYNSESNTKEYNIYIGYSDWVIISSNNLFESGFESILLKYARHANISNNNIAWCGQRIASSGIKIEQESSLSIKCIISNNNLSKVTKHGVELIYSKNGIVKNNFIEACITADEDTFYGIEDLSSFTHYSVYQENCEYILFDNHDYNTTDCNLMRPSFQRKLQIDDTRTELDTKYTDYFILNQSSASILTSFKNGTNGKDIMLIAFNANTSIFQSSNIYLANGDTSLSIPNRGIISFRYYAGTWFESFRSF